MDEFWSYVGNKKNKVRLIYAYHRASGEIVAFVWGKRNLKTAKQLRKKLSDLGVSFNTVYSDDWESFKGAFAADNHITGKENTVGIEGNNCRYPARQSTRSGRCPAPTKSLEQIDP